VTRIGVLALAVLGLGAAPAQSATKGYSTGNINARIGGHLDESLTVADAGPVSFVRVSFRITARDTSALALSLVSPKGTVVPLVTHRGAGADFGSDEKGCGGIATVFESDSTTNPVTAGTSPFTDNPYRAEGNLGSLYHEDAKGRWTLEVDNNGAPATLHCLTLDISRAVREMLSSHLGGVTASVSFVEKNSFYEQLRLKIVRGGRTALDSPVQRLRCRDCDTFRPVSVKVRDLDGGEPEMLLELYTQGAHCCTVVLALRHDAAAGAYRPKLLLFGNYGYKLADLDHDGLPEFSAFDERLIYTFGAYVFSSAPPEISQYREGRLIDVTRRFPAVIRRNAARVGKEFLTKQRPPSDEDLRTFVAVYVADQYLLGRPAEAKRALDYALAHGLLYRGRNYLGAPAGANFVRVLMRDLRKWGYLHGR
jgi:subtilisin-like proprotein convertase family protein